MVKDFIVALWADYSQSAFREQMGISFRQREFDAWGSANPETGRSFTSASTPC